MQGIYYTGEGRVEKPNKRQGNNQTSQRRHYHHHRAWNKSVNILPALRAQIQEGTWNFEGDGAPGREGVEKCSASPFLSSSNVLPVSARSHLVKSLGVSACTVGLPVIRSNGSGREAELIQVPACHSPSLLAQHLFYVVLMELHGLKKEQ